MCIRDRYVTPNEDIEVKVSSFYTKIKEPVLANPKLKFPNGVRVSKLYPNPLPDLFKGEEIVLVGRYSKAGKGDVLLDGTVNGDKVQTEFGVTFPKVADRDFIPRLWATRRVGFLLDEIRLHGEKKELKEEITRLARQYGIVTPYTAYLIIEDERRRGVPIAARTLTRLEADREVLEQARQQFDGFKRDKAGALLPMGVKVDDKVLLPQYGGNEVTIDDEEVVLFRDDDIMGARRHRRRAARALSLIHISEPTRPY